jgi:hypothetical protein
MAPFFAKQSCDPFQPRDRPCELGNYVRYAVNASGPADVQRTIAFAASKNIRLVVRNTGHDYLGRSTAFGSLAVWTHHLKAIDHIPAYKGSGYNGPAFKIGAGVQGFEIMAAARDQGLVVVGGECPTVGIAGGYTQGGGHSAISTSFGLAADNVLSWEIVTASGKLVNANQRENSDPILAPFIARLDSKSVNYTASYSEFDTYYEHYDKYFGPLPLGNIQVGIAQYGTRLIPRSVVGNITTTWKTIVEQGVTWIGVGTDVKPFGTEKTTSVHPAWRKAIVHATLTLPWNFTAPWSEALATQDKMTNEIQPLIEAATPGSGSYVNEADWRQPNFQTTFWGSNYGRLLSVKRKWDPSGIFYATVGVGSEAWTVKGDGRLCRA